MSGDEIVEDEMFGTQEYADDTLVNRLIKVL
jgi:hypothetical protein